MNRVPNAAKRAATLLGLATGAVLLAATAAQAAPAAPAAAEGSVRLSASVAAATLQPGAAAAAGVNGDPRAHIDDTSEWNTIASRPLPSGGQL
ncbi:hypothetical protein ACFC1T_23945 [Kitasatospora sp. NPDC056076]|uniref:hypothetical protein n=1 Tax=Kitasatospora sp. NPDC056076 TaxID=3345703 RepID=UPI0035E31D56